MAVITNLAAVNVINIGTTAGIFIGQNNQFGWGSHRKYNMGGQAFGLSNHLPWVTLIKDDSLIDTAINDQDLMNGSAIQSI